MDFNKFLNEKRITVKRRYTENHPAVEVGQSARIRNKVLEAIADGKITVEEFDKLVSELSNDSKRWTKTNSRYFNVSEDGISLSSFGKRILKNITVNESALNEEKSAAEKLADETSGELYDATLRGSSATVTATTTTQTWEDGVPVLKYLARGKGKPVKMEKKVFKVVHDVAHGWFYFTDGRKWFGLHLSDGYADPSDLPFDVKISESTVTEATTKNPEVWVPGGFDKEVGKLKASQITRDKIIQLAKKYEVGVVDAIEYVEFGWSVDLSENKNTDMKNKFIYESFTEFVGSLNENTEMINEGTRGFFGKIDKAGNISAVYTHYDSYPEWVLPVIKKNYKNSKAVDAVIAKGDNSGLDVIDKMNFYNDKNSMTPLKGKKDSVYKFIKDASNSSAEFVYLYDEADKKWYMADTYSDKELKPAFESIVNQQNEQLFEATVEMDAMDPDNKDFLKFLKKHKVTIIDKMMDGPGGGHPVIVMQGKRKDLEAVLADEEFGWADPDLAEYIEESIQIVEEFRPLNEAFKSSKLQNLLAMKNSGADANYYGNKNLPSALYGLTKIKLDQIEDSALVDTDPNTAYKTYANNRDYLVFYIVDTEKENPYADRASYRQPVLSPGILALSRGKDFLGVEYKGYAKIPNVNKKNQHILGKADGSSAVGGNKAYRGYDASGISSIKRAAELADRAIVFSIVSGGESAASLIKDRSDAKSGAAAFMTADQFKKANKQRYQDILATKASSLPLDKIVSDAIDELSNQMKDAMARNEKGRYGDILVGKNAKGAEVKLRDVGTHMSRILDDYERYVSNVKQAEEEKAQGFSSNYYDKEAKNYAKSVSDRVKQIKGFDYAW